MSSPVSTLSNFNGIDFNVILNAVIQQASQPMYTLQTKQANNTKERTAFGTLATKLGNLETAATELSTQSQAVDFTASVSDSTALSVTATSSAQAGTYSLVVDHLAKAQATASTSFAADSDTTVVATGGKLTIGGVEVSLSGSVTLGDLASAINTTTDMKVSAAVVQTAPAQYRLMLTAKDTGTANAFTVTNNLTGGAGVTFGGNTVEATDAGLTLNGLSIVSSSNTLTAAIPGATVDLLSADATKTVSVTIANDDDALKGKIDDVISAYNDVVNFMQAQANSAASGNDGTIAHEPLLAQLRNDLRSVLSGSYGTDTFKGLAEVGVGFDQTGKMTLDKTVLSDALEADRTAVFSLFVGTKTNSTGFTNGAFGTLRESIDAYTRAGGFVLAAQTRIDKSNQRLSDQIADMQARLLVQREALQREYTAAEQAMTQLKAQSGNLSSTMSPTQNA